MATRTSAPKKASSRSLDFTNVRDRGPYNPKHVESGDYVAVISGVQETESNAGNEMWVYAFQLEEHASYVYPYHCVLDPDSLWKVRNVFEAAGITVPKRKVKVDPNKVVGRKVIISLDDDEYEGKPKSVISAIMPLSEEDGDDDEPEEDEEVEERPARSRRSRKAREPEPEEDEEEEDEEEEPPARSRRKSSSSRRRQSEEDEDEDEEEEPPARSRKRKSTATKKKTSRRSRKDEDEDEDEFDELDTDDL